MGRECSACVGAEGASGVAGWRHRWTASAVAVPARGAAGARCADTASAPTAPAVGPSAAPGRGHSTLCQISLALALGDDAVGRCPRMARRVSAPNESGTPGGAHPEHRSTAMIAVDPLEFSVPYEKNRFSLWGSTPILLMNLMGHSEKRVIFTLRSSGVEVGGGEGLATSSHVGDQPWRFFQQHHTLINHIRGQTCVIGGEIVPEMQRRPAKPREWHPNKLVKITRKPSLDRKRTWR